MQGWRKYLRRAAPDRGAAEAGALTGRRLFALVAALMFVDGLFFVALGPLLPGLRREFSLTAFQAGLLGSGYALGAFVGGVPAALLAARLGVKATVVVSTFVLAAMTLGFAFAQNYPELLAAQLGAGVGSAGLWVAALPWLIEETEAQRRGEVIGAVLAAVAAGEIVGPVVGGVSASTGRGVTFASVAVIAGLLAGVALVTDPPTGAAAEALSPSAGVAWRRTGAAGTLAAVPAVLLGALLLLGPLQLSHIGGRSGEIAAVFVLSGVGAVILGPRVGRWSDRRGRLPPIRFGVLASMGIMLALALSPWRDVVVMSVLVVAAMMVFRFVQGPSIALLSDVCDREGSSQVLSFLVVLLVNTAGTAAGSTGSGWLLQTVGFRWSWVTAAVSLAAVSVALAWWPVTEVTTLEVTESAAGTGD